MCYEMIKILVYCKYIVKTKNLLLLNNTMIFIDQIYQTICIFGIINKTRSNECNHKTNDMTRNLSEALLVYLQHVTTILQLSATLFIHHGLEVLYSALIIQVRPALVIYHVLEMLHSELPV